MVGVDISPRGMFVSYFTRTHIHTNTHTHTYTLLWQEFRILNTADIRVVPKWLFPPRSSNKTRFTSTQSRSFGAG